MRELENGRYRTTSRPPVKEQPTEKGKAVGSRSSRSRKPQPKADAAGKEKRSGRTGKSGAQEKAVPPRKKPLPRKRFTRCAGTLTATAGKTATSCKPM
ncbi:hypothetical protein GN277_19875 [Lachnospiraceae bacterium WCA-9-b2]|uniref:Uncharacterized protein n=1 Tax=Sporofaciens musculi TaxID=2681861 RepID=A0A7X3SKH5_9FIRM|nr:hypothetical protein [Sporofaciens musculi]MXP77532.1 hypothetical protein [Sporofaciens musculi]